ncbi:MAG TPA: NAD-dependent epimerase/dehydratase family protein [Pseudonocardiaceae bacterium]|jgi:nucleoside-diphosphate-sugar epimerase|nr:NAD-dependent epimerase/dehydratase family protein [Pseudonocardiaceae bacterium]
MLVCVTGGTGFVGAHSVAALVRIGHRVRILARDEAGVERALTPLGVDPAAVDVVVGDVTNEIAVARATAGVGGVLHAASVYSFDPRRAAELSATNVRGTELVLAAARRVGANPTVHVSSFGALLPARNRVISADSPVGHAREPYLASKAAAETVARQYQVTGSPVVITYPPALLGPADPHLGDQNARLRNALRGLMPIWPLGGYPVGDVRDTAALHAALFTEPELTRDRYFGPGRYLTTRRQVRALRTATGRALPAVFLPAMAMLPVGRLADAVQRVWPWHIPAEYGAIYTCACATRVVDYDSTLGITPRPLADTVTDTIRWLYDTGRITDRQAGILTSRPAASSALSGRGRSAA